MRCRNCNEKLESDKYYIDIIGSWYCEGCYKNMKLAFNEIANEIEANIKSAMNQFKNKLSEKKITPKEFNGHHFYI